MRKFTILLVLIAFSSPLFSQWSTDPHVNNTVTSAAGRQKNVISCVDGSGGVIIAWADQPSQKLYAQRINSSGQTIWTSGGIVIGDIHVTNNAIIRDLNTCICSDAAGGAIIGWADPDGGIYAQRVRGDGIFLWSSGGVRVTSAGHNLVSQVRCIGAEAANTIFGWYDGECIYSQKVDAYGARLWDTSDVKISYYQPGSFGGPIFDMCKDAKNGAYFSYSMVNSISPAFYSDIYAQRINSSGSTLWDTIHHVAEYSAAQFYPAMCEDQDYGCIITWTDERNGLNWDIYGARLDSNGYNQWTTNGEPVCIADADQTFASCISDAHGGAYITWVEDKYSLGIYGYYGMTMGAQNINHNGEIQWGSNGKFLGGGVEIYGTPDGRNNPPISCVDALGGLIVCWLGVHNFSGYGIVAQRIQYNGDSLWGGGVLVTTGDDIMGPALVSDGGSSGCIIAWNQSRNTDSTNNIFDIYAQHVKSNSNLGNRPGANPSLAPVTSGLKQNYPNPFNPVTNISFDISSQGFISLKIYDMTGREVAELVKGVYEPGEYTVSWNASNFASGVYLYRFVTDNKVETKTMMIIK